MTIGAKVLYSEMPDVQAFSQHGKVIQTSLFVTSFWRRHWATPTTSRGFPDESICSDVAKRFPKGP